jgi:multiple sugar transport system permease protein
MISSSFMTLDDLLDSSIKWIPSSVNLNNYIQAAKSMDFWMSLLKSVILAGVPTIGNLISCALAGYGLARFEFPGKKIAIGLIVFSFILPAQITMIATYRLYNDIGILNTIWAFILPAVLAVGLNAPIFILIFYQFFKQVPKVLIEAAQIDGAGYLKSFLQISVPSAAPAFITVGLFSFVWYWNETVQSGLFLKGEHMTLPLQLEKFNALFGAAYPSSQGRSLNRLNERIQMAATLLTVAPLMVLYLIMQRKFVQGVESSGITGE